LHKGNETKRIDENLLFSANFIIRRSTFVNFIRNP
jgi:hypothetical protein